MNAVEIEEALSNLAGQPFDATEFPFAFLTAFGNKETTVKRLRAGSGNTSDVRGGVLQRNNIHMAVCADGLVGVTLAALRASPKTAANRVKFILATDGTVLEAEDIVAGETIACEYPKIADHFGFFLPLAGISTVKQIKNNPIDIKATGRLNKLYIALLDDNPDWATVERRHDLNQFMARLIFCFFAEDTGIFEPRQFSKTVEQMSDGQSTNTHEVIAELFRAMNTPLAARALGKFRPWVNGFPYVNGGLYAGEAACPRFSRIARTYFLRAAELDWREINPDIFGSMIQAVADDDERDELGMHYTSVPNIVKVLNPLFLDDLREKLEAAGNNIRKLKNLRRRIGNIRVFDPACGSGNFLVIAYRQMRDIEAEIIRRADDKPKSWIKLENFFGIEIKSFAAEIARLALLIAEFQCDVRLINQREAKLNVLPLHKTGQIHIGNALRLSWLEVCPPVAKTIVEEWDLGGPTGRLALDDNGISEADEPETYICGNPPYAGSKMQTDEQRRDLNDVFKASNKNFKTLDYVACWILRAVEYIEKNRAVFAFVTTNSICQGEQVALIWPSVFSSGLAILFAYRSFKWRNLAAHNAGVTCVIVGVGRPNFRPRKIYEDETARQVAQIGPYLIQMDDVIVSKHSNSISELPLMQFGNHPYYAMDLVMSITESHDMVARDIRCRTFLRPIYGSHELVTNTPRMCLWIKDNQVEEAKTIPVVLQKMQLVQEKRLAATKDVAAQMLAKQPYRFRDRNEAKNHIVIVPRVTSENRDFLPVGILDSRCVVQDAAFAMYDAPLWSIALIASRIHLVWIATVCGKLKTDFRYSNTLGWNTFPVPSLTAKNEADLSRCAEDILFAREAHFPATIADLYEPDKMPDDLRQAHEHNDDVLERIYIGRRFRNDTERLEKLFELYAKMTADNPRKKGAA